MIHMKDEKTVLTAFLVVILAVAMAVGGFLMIEYMQKFGESDPLKAPHTYAGEGYVIEDGGVVQCTGDGSSRYVSETEGDLTYLFELRYTSQSGYSGSASTVLLCSSDGVPVSEFYSRTEVEGQWEYHDGDRTFFFTLSEDHVVTELVMISKLVDMKYALVS